MPVLSRNTITKTPHCGACEKAGKTVAEYTSHWTRSTPGESGVITCPLILSAECGFCHGIGHWTKMCPEIKEQKQKTEKEQRTAAFKSKAISVNNPKQVRISGKSAAKNTTGFDALYDSSDDEDLVASKKKKDLSDFPVMSSTILPSKEKKNNLAAKPNWSAWKDNLIKEQSKTAVEAAAKAKAAPTESAAAGGGGGGENNITVIVHDFNPKKSKKSKKPFSKSSSWADAESSDDDDDDDEDNSMYKVNKMTFVPLGEFA